MTRISGKILWLFASLSSGCGALVGSDYEGEPYAELSVTLRKGQEVGAVGELEFVGGWTYDGGGRARTTFYTAYDHVGTFPGPFVVKIQKNFAKLQGLYDFSPRGRGPSEARIGLASLHVIPKEKACEDLDLARLDPDDPDPREGNPQCDWFATLQRYVLAYVESDTLSHTFAEQLLGAPLKAGYHLLTATPSAEFYGEGYPAVLEQYENCRKRVETECDGGPVGSMAWREWEACAYKVGCRLPDPTWDVLRPAPSGFETPLEIEMTRDPALAIAPHVLRFD